ncbi:phosphoenolpyruvate synthase [Mycolicibacterium sp. CH28]|uniref:PEP/pyruvate-binding domain-containing protein n=1 Tax=Mycolicibacterium sp. CH28 TaxID=2512237 RepID=UPI001081B1C1|nr:PEP/pyruvate-binding domain-containing protein [Mycolicibacterium sp. CH28]TGD86573.1 phosphoenolpyruvate synthase [Mycolicibacterium sp. CH28]
MIRRLSASTPADVEKIGGKAAGLVRLLRTGMDVPEAWVIEVSASLDPDVRATLLTAELPRWWQEADAEFPGSCWAVRSSAVAEDLDHASFAGVYETVLGVRSFDGLLDALRHCWAAVAFDRAEAYRSKSGSDADGGIAVIIQRMLQPRVAGVLLTVDPLRPFDDHLVIDAAYGLGESVVSGATDPDHYVLRRSTGEELSRRIGQKATERLWADGVQTRDVDASRRAQPCLSADDLAALHAAAQRVERGIGPQRDLEWAIDGGTVYLLQDRPITGLPPRNPTDIHSRRYGDEYLAEYCYPLAVDLLLRWIDETRAEVDTLIDRHEPAIPSTRVYNGYAYLSGNWALRSVRALPASARTSVCAWFPPALRDQMTAEPFRVRLFLALLRAPYTDKGRGPLLKNPAALERHCATIERVIAPKLDQDYAAKSAGDLRRQFDEADALGLDHFRVIRWGMAMYNPMLHSVLPALLARWCADHDGALYEAIISGLPDTMTARLNRELFGLADAARANPALRQAMVTEKDLGKVRTQVPDDAFWPRFDEFVARHGHRSGSRDIAQPRWRETPEVILGMIAAQLHMDVAINPADAERKAIARRQHAELTARQRTGGLRNRLLRKVIELTQQYTVYRENQRYYLDYLLTHMRELTLEYGRRLTAQGALDHPQQVFFLQGAELWALVDGGSVPADLADRLDQRHRHWALHRNRLPSTYLYDGVEVDESAVDDAPEDLIDAGCMRGVPASRGVVRGTTRVVHDLSGLSAVEPGDILVVSNIDPGWTSVFPALGGLVTATGGTLSHGAILAREYGIPTVTNVKDVLALLPTGTTVEVDGGRGTIVIV